MRGVGTIAFNEIFVNEKDAYDPRTGEWCLHGPKPKRFCSDLVQSGFVIKHRPHIVNSKSPHFLSGLKEIRRSVKTKLQRNAHYYSLSSPPAYMALNCPPGYFTAPVRGKYFFSGILTGHKNVKIEAVLSKSNKGVARVDSAGYQPEGLEKPMAEAKHIPGALSVFNIILPLEAGDTVCIDLVTGRLAYSSEPLTMFSGMLLYETT